MSLRKELLKLQLHGSLKGKENCKLLQSHANDSTFESEAVFFGVNSGKQCIHCIIHVGNSQNSLHYKIDI